VSVPQPRHAHELRNRRRRALAISSQTRKFEPLEERLHPQQIQHEGKSHRLTWFEALQGLLFLSVVMLGATYAVASGLLICAAIGTCVAAIVTSCLRIGAPKPLHLVLATLWAFVGAIYIAAHMI
jgi:hypothetical protein